MAFLPMTVQELMTFAESCPVTLIDIRDPASFAKGCIPGAVRIDNSNLETFIAKADKTLPLVVCCYHGNSSQGAADYFNQRGFARTYSLEGGFAQWSLQNP